jgi:hypothetical protein
VIHQISIAPVILLPARGLASDFRRIAQPNRMAQFHQHLFEPGAITTGFEGHDYLPSKLLVKPAHIIVLMPQVPVMNLAISRIAITNRLFTRMKIHRDVYCHWGTSFGIRKTTGLEFTNSRREVPFHDIKGKPLESGSALRLCAFALETFPA